MYQDTLTELIYRIAFEKNISVRELCLRSGVGESTLEMARIRHSELKMTTLQKICDTLGIRLSALIAACEEEIQCKGEKQ